MSVFEARCTSCGAPLEIHEREKISTCKYCHNTVVVSHAKELGLVEIDKTKDLETYRSNLAVAVMHNSLDELQRIGGQIKDLIPNDFRANYYFAYAKQQQNQPKFMYQFLNNTYEYTKEEYKEILDHIIRRSDLRDKPRILDFIKRTEETYQEQYSKMHHEREQAEDNYAVIPRDVFICFSSFNQEIAEEVVKKLEEDGNTCWISTRNLRPEDSENYWTNIEQAIDHTEIVLVVSSEDAMRSKDVQQEVRFAKEKNKKLVEFKIDQKPHSTLFKHIFDGNKWVNGKKNVNQDYTSLLQRVYEEKHESKAPTDMVGEYIPKRRRNKRVGLGFFALALVVIGGIVGYLMMNAGTGDEVLGSEEDTEAPVIELKGLEDITLEVGQQFVDPGVTVSDNQEQDIQAVVVGNVDTTELGAYLITYYATDQAGNQATSVTRTVHVTDSLAPIITINGQREITLEVHSTYNDLGARVNDNYDENVSLDIDGSVDTSVLGTYEITYNAMDSLGNEAAEVVRTVHVVDTTPPSISLNGKSAYYQNIDTVFTDPWVTVSDNYDTNLTVDVIGEVDSLQEGAYTLIYQVTDSSGNKSVVLTRTVEVIDFLANDNEAPVITLQGDSYIVIEVGNAYEDLGVTVEDNYSQNLTANISGSVDTSTLGTYEIIYNVTDEAGNVAEEVIRTIVVEDNTGPVIELNGLETITISIGSSYSEEGVTVSDNFDSIENLTIVINGTVDVETEGTYTITYQAIDSSGNTTTTIRTVEVYDDIVAPIITLQGDDYLEIEAGSTYEEQGAIIEDDYSQNLTANISGSVDTSTLGTYEIIYNVTDEAGNAATEVVRTIVIVDTTSPTLSLNGPETLRVAIDSIYTDDGVKVSDNYDKLEDITIIVTGTVDFNTEGTYTITYQAIDSSGNESVVLSRTVEVKDFTADFTWNLKVNGTYEVTGYIGTDSDITIPNQVNGIDVTSIGEDAFRDLNITSVYISSTIQEIKQSAFQDCQYLSEIYFAENSNLFVVGSGSLSGTNITAIRFPDSLVRVEAGAIEWSDITYVYLSKNVSNISGLSIKGGNLQNYDVNPENPYYTSVDGVLFTKDMSTLVAYPGGKVDVSYIVPNTVTTIGVGALYGNSSLRSITLPENLQLIERLAFYRSQNIATIHMGQYVNVSEGAFGGMDGTSSITVDSNNPYFLSVDGVLFSKDMTKLIVYPSGKKDVMYTVKSNINTILDSAFGYNSYLRILIIEDGIQIIESTAMIAMESLEKIYIPYSVTSVGERLLYNSPIATVYSERESKPLSWSPDWNVGYDGRILPVIWGYTQLPPEYFSTVPYGGGIMITGYNEHGPKDVVIPNQINGFDVLAIGDNAFDNIGLNSVLLPENVITIGEEAFQNNNLVQLNIPEGITVIRMGAFRGNQIENLVLPDSLEIIEDWAFDNNNLSYLYLPLNLREITYYAFINGNNIETFDLDPNNPYLEIIDGLVYTEDMTKLLFGPQNYYTTSIMIPEGVKAIQPLAFFNMGLYSITLPESLETIGEMAFYSNNLTELSFGPNVREIGNTTFIFNNIANYYVDVNNSYFTSEDGILFNKSLTELIAFPQNYHSSSYEIPNTVSTIRDAAFRNSNISEIILPSNITSIENYTFANTNLTSVVIPDSVTLINQSAFRDSQILSVVFSDSLTHISYGAFEGNYLTSVTIPASVTQIDPNAFNQNPLIEVIILGDESRFNDVWEEIGFPIELRPE